MYQTTLRKLNRFMIHNRLLILLIMLLTILTVFPFIHIYQEEYVFTLHFLFSLILLIGIYVASNNRQLLTVAILLALLTITVLAFNTVLENHSLNLFGLLLEVIFFTITAITTITHVLEERRITADKIYGAISAYLLFGLIWALIYNMIEVQTPGAFEFNPNLKFSIFEEPTKPFYFVHFIYYSLITLTTTGYGDITPLNAAARVFSSIEAILGQLYVAVLIGRLVGLHIHATHQRHTESKD